MDHRGRGDPGDRPADTRGGKRDDDRERRRSKTDGGGRDGEPADRPEQRCGDPFTTDEGRGR